MPTKNRLEEERFEWLRSRVFENGRKLNTWLGVMGLVGEGRGGQGGNWGKGHFGLSDVCQGELRPGVQGGTRGQRASNARQRSVWILSQGFSNCVPWNPGALGKDPRP